MGNNYKFRLSWLYNKLRDPKTSSTKSRPKSSSPRIKPRHDTIPPSAVADHDPHRSNPRKSYHFTRELSVDPHAEHFRQKTIGSMKEDKSGRHVSSCSLSSTTSTSNTTSCSSPPRPSPEFRFDRVLTPDPVDKTTSSSSSSSLSASRSMSDPDINPLGLSPISTTKKKKNKKVVNDAATERKRGSNKRLSLSTSAKSPGTRIRVHSPRLLAAARRMQARKGATRPTRSVEETTGRCRGFAVVKSSFDPWRDFRESMVEMIVENRIKESEDLEDLLVCYLSLNSEEYHEVIIAAFKQIWFDLTDIRLNANSCP